MTYNPLEARCVFISGPVAIFLHDAPAIEVEQNFLIVLQYAQLRLTQLRSPQCNKPNSKPSLTELWKLVEASSLPKGENTPGLETDSPTSSVEPPSPDAPLSKSSSSISPNTTTPFQPSSETTPLVRTALTALEARARYLQNLSKDGSTT
jgi:hypothetical protein